MWTGVKKTGFSCGRHKRMSPYQYVNRYFGSNLLAFCEQRVIFERTLFVSRNQHLSMEDTQGRREPRRALELTSQGGPRGQKFLFCRPISIF